MRGHRPIIGVSSYVEPIDRAPWFGQRSAVLPYGYVKHLMAAGALVVILPPRVDADEAMAAQVLAGLDGLVISGGADVEASRYGAAPHATSQAARADRDTWELALVAAATAADLPLLGICRGMQVMAVAAGAGLVQDLPEAVGTTVHCPAPGTYASHPVTLVSGTRLAGVLTENVVDVPTYHHQAVDPVTLSPTPYVPSAWHEDGTLEAMEDPAGTFRFAVQWHPEAGEDPRLFDALVATSCDRARAATVRVHSRPQNSADANS